MWVSFRTTLNLNQNNVFLIIYSNQFILNAITRNTQTKQNPNIHIALWQRQTKIKHSAYTNSTMPNRHIS